MTPPPATELADPPAGAAPPAATRSQMEGHGGGGDSIFRGVALVAGLAVLAILGPHRLVDDQGGVAGLHQPGPQLRHVRRVGPAGGQVRRPGLHLRHAAVVVHRPGASRCRSASASPCSPTRPRPGACAQPVTYVIDLLAAVPSVVYGLWGVLVLRPQHPARVYQSIADATDGIPVLGAIFGGAASGRSFMTAGLILAIMIMPIVTSLSREVIATVPQVAARGGLRHGRHPVGDDPLLGAAVEPRRHHRRGHARPRPGHGRDHRGGPGDRLDRPDHRRTCSSPATPWPR